MLRKGNQFLMTPTNDKQPEPAAGLKIGGMALENGVLFQTERHWAMAVRGEDGVIEVSSGTKHLPAPLRRMRRVPLLRGLVSLAETATVLPRAHAHGGQLAAFSRSPQLLATMIVSVLGTMVVRNSRRKLSPAVEEIAVSALSLVPTLMALRKSRAIQYHAAEHKSINAFEATGFADVVRAREARAEHPRCGSNIIGPAMVLMTVGNTVVRRYMKRRSNAARLGVGLLSMSGAVELVQWAARHPGSIMAKALTGPGEELQHLLTTAEPTREQLDVGLSALRELLRLEGAWQGGFEPELL